MQRTDPKELKKFIEDRITKNTKKIRGKHSPIAEIGDNKILSLPVKFIFDLRGILDHFYLIGVKNYSKHPKIRYFLAISLANSSSDLLVSIAKEFAVKNELKLLQYSIFLKTLRIQLLSLKEIKNIDDYRNIVEILKMFRAQFREILDKIRKLV
ncbi:MAG: hypothetical protein ACW990_05820 [Promethearchaeota archaeon]|jgi:hypothetical protein